MTHSYRLTVDSVLGCEHFLDQQEASQRGKQVCGPSLLPLPLEAEVRQEPVLLSPRKLPALPGACRGLPTGVEV